MDMFVFNYDIWVGYILEYFTSDGYDSQSMHVMH